MKVLSLATGVVLCGLLALMPSACVSQKDNKADAQDYLRYVDPYIGSGEHGHVFVGASVPLGMVQAGPQNIHKGWDWCSGYHYSDSVLIGFSHTHLSGTGCADLGDVLLMPYVGEVRTARGEQDNIEGSCSTYYSHKNEQVAPGYYSLLMDNGVRAELTATDRVAIHRYIYPEGTPRLLVNLKEGNGDRAFETGLKRVDEYTVEGYRFSRGWSPQHKVFFVLKSEQPIESVAVFDDDTPAGQDTLTGKAVKGVLTFKDNPKNVQLKVALSSVSCANALANLEAEQPGWDFEKVRTDAEKRWNEMLSCINVESSDERGKKIFYTSLYHMFIAPTLYADVNGEFRGHDDKIYKADSWTNYSTFSLWDTYRTLHPLLTIIQPQLVPDMVNSMLSIYDQQGKLPIWPLVGGETNQMPGYSAIPVIADAYLKGIGDFDAEKALAACVATANLDNYRGIGFYKKNGYVPFDLDNPSGGDDWSLSKTLEYAFDDYCIAVMADKMGKKDIAEEFYARSQNYRNVYNPTSTFMQPKDKAGQFVKNFQAEDYTPHICESNGWQYFWSVQHDINGLIALSGGQERFAQKLDSMFTFQPSDKSKLPIFSTGMIGQYAHGNEPGHHVAYLYNKVNQPWKGQKYLRQIMTTLYTNTPAGLCGNEDCGQMSAWYVFSAMGFYPVNPVSGEYEIGSPLFPETVLQLTNGKTFKITAHNMNPENTYIQSVKLNGQPLGKSYITHQQIMEGGTLDIEMGSSPGKTWW